MLGGGSAQSCRRAGGRAGSGEQVAQSEGRERKKKWGEARKLIRKELINKSEREEESEDRGEGLAGHIYL